MIRKTMQITITFTLVVSLLGVGLVPASYACGGTCCCSMQQSMASGKPTQGSKVVSGPAGCCCHPQEPARDIAQGCRLKPSDLPRAALLRAVDGPVPLTAIVTNPMAPLDSLSVGYSHEVHPVGPGPPLLLFLFNQSFLC
jgi:hypothetical protein